MGFYSGRVKVLATLASGGAVLRRLEVFKLFCLKLEVGAEARSVGRFVVVAAEAAAAAMES